MISYLLKRILLFVPTLIVASMLTFGLSRLAPGNQVVEYLRQDPFGLVSSQNDLLVAEKKYADAAQALNLDKPAFYLSLTSKAFPDTLHRIALPDRRATMKKITAQYGNWPQVAAYFHSLREMEWQLLGLPDSLAGAATAFKLELRDLYLTSEDNSVRAKLEKMKNQLAAQPAIQPFLSAGFDFLKNNYSEIKRKATPGRMKVPTIHWHGFDNQYHHWFSRFVCGDFGLSVFQRRPVADIVGPALFWTVVLNLTAILLAFGVAVPLGLWSAVRKGERFDKVTSLSLFMLYSLPTFWVGTMLLVFFTTREYGMPFFKGAWLGHLPQGASFFEKLKVMYPYLVLPILCVAYPAVAFIARQARGSMVEVLKMDFIRTARAKGLPESKVIWRHGLRNALFPIITLIASVLPAAIAGSVVVEMIFNLPGIGLTMLRAITEQDWPIVFAIMMLGAVLTVAGMLLSDVLYALADPRVKF